MLYGFKDFRGIFLHVCTKNKLLREGLILVHLNIARFEDVRSNWDFSFDFSFIYDPYGVPFAGTEVWKLDVFGSESDMNI